VYPRAYLTKTGVPIDQHGVLANFCFLSKTDNTTLGGVAPSAYKGRMPAAVDEILRRALCPPSLFADDYRRFLAERAELLERSATAVMQ
jgi:hypothetical protein